MSNLVVRTGCRFALSAIAAPAIGLALVAAGSVQPAHALLTYNIFETTDGNVVVQTDGRLNLPQPSNVAGNCLPGGAIASLSAGICTGFPKTSPSYYISGPSRFDGLVDIFPASSVDGIFTLLLGSSRRFFIDRDYISGTAISSRATFNNTTLKSLGFTTTGLIGEWEFVDAPDQKIRVVLTEVPGPLPLVGAGAAFAFSRRLRRRIASSQAATPPQA